MKTSPVTFEDMARSVIAVPPLARNADLTVNQAENKKLVQHLQAGGVTTLLYGGNANFYNLGLYEYADLLSMLAEIAAPESLVIPSAGPDFGKLMDQMSILRGLNFPTVMVLPLSFPTTTAGVETGIRRFAEAYGRPIILYIKFEEGYLKPDGVRRLVDDGLVSAIKYALARANSAEDSYLARLVDIVDPRYIVSGIGERPAIVHLRDFGLNGFTSGSVCIASKSSTKLLQALKGGNYLAAEEIRQRFLSFEDLRDSISPIRVLHEAVRLVGIADTGPMLPMLTGLPDNQAKDVAIAARELLAYSDPEYRLAALAPDAS